MGNDVKVLVQVHQLVLEEVSEGEPLVDGHLEVKGGLICGDAATGVVDLLVIGGGIARQFLAEHRRVGVWGRRDLRFDFYLFLDDDRLFDDLFHFFLDDDRLFDDDGLGLTGDEGRSGSSRTQHS